MRFIATCLETDRTVSVEKLQEMNGVMGMCLKKKEMFYISTSHMTPLEWQEC